MSQDGSTAKSRSTTIAILAVGWVLADSMMTYFSRSFLGVLLPVSLLLPFIILLISIRSGWEGFSLPGNIAIALYIALFAFICGLIINDEYTLTKIGAPVLAVCVFLIGYYAFRWATDERPFVILFIAVSLAYGAVCTAALLRVAPSIFPMIEFYWSNEGALVLRPEITTDQNFQYFYLFPATALLLLPYKLMRTGFVILATVVSAYVLVTLQTRSGVLTFIGLVGLTMLAPLKYRELGRAKVLLIPVLAIGLIIIYQENVFSLISNLLARLSDKGAQETGYERIASTLYIFRQLADPIAWFIPQGNKEFLSEYGVKPHSNVSAMFAEGAIWGLYMWLVVFVLPVISLFSLYLKKSLDTLALIVLCAGVSMLVLQISLNVPFFKQPWLWAGAIVGTLVRIRSGENGAPAGELRIDGESASPRVILKKEDGERTL